MSRLPDQSGWRLVFLLGLLVVFGATAATASDRFPGIGRAATPAELAAWDTDVRPDFRGLPPGSGSVAQGQDVWEAKCASCHGIFGESNQVFNPVIGGTSADDVKSGRVARLTDQGYPGRTTLMKVPTLSTLWDYIYRAMPWNQPKSLTPDEVYAVTAFMLHLGNVVPQEFVLSNRNMQEAQARLPNRDGMTTQHALWPGTEFGGTDRADVRARACMQNCPDAGRVTSTLPDYARNQHGNLAEQNRLVGAQRGADTSRAEVVAFAPAVPVSAATPLAAVVAKADSAAGNSKLALALSAKYACTACHGVAQKIVGPGFSEIARKHPGKVDYLAGKIRSGSAGVWGVVPMPAQNLPEADARIIAAWLAAGAAK